MPASKSKKKSAQKKAPDETRREVIGVCLIAVGIFFGASIYSEAVGIVGKAVSTVMFGVFGFAGYAIPVAIAAWGVLLIVFSDKKPGTALVLLVLLFIISIMGMLHLGARSSIEDVSTVKFFDYIKDAFVYGNTYLAGGGALGAAPAYALSLLLGRVGAYIAFITAVLVSFLLVTRISLKRTGQKIGTDIKRGAETVAEKMSERRQALHIEGEREEERRTSRAASRATSRGTKKQEKPSFNTDYDDFTEPNKKRKKAAGSGARVDDSLDELDFIPASGALEKKRVKREERIEREFEDMEAADEASLSSAEFDENGFAYDTPDTTDAKPTRITRFAPLDNVARSEAPAASEVVASREVAPKEYFDSTEVYIPASSYQYSLAEDAARAVREAEARGDDDDEASAITPNDASLCPYQRPPFSLLNMPDPARASTEAPSDKARLLEQTLASFSISARVINYSVGPVITRFELQPAQGVRVNRITSLSKDIALALAASRVRIEAPIPGKAAIGIEVPNKNTASVVLREMVESQEFQTHKSSIAFALGKDIAGKTIVADLDKMPHLLIAGATGSGKSVCINDIILSMAYKSAPKDVRMVLIDPKVVEMRVYASLPHLMLPVVTDPKKAAGALKWTVMEMERRYQAMAKVNARDLARFNALQTTEEEKLPKLIVVIDELADLMMVSAKDVEDSICRIAQLGRAAGIHLIVATQRPSADVITGLIKANIPSRIAFMVSSGTDSRVILDENGAEKLLGRGDMLFHANGASKPSRVQGAFVSDEEVENIMQFFSDHQSMPSMEEDTLERMTAAAAQATGAPQQGNGKQEDELLPEAVRVVLDSGQASISMIQRRLRVGYARAARLIDIMEKQKIVSGFDGSKPRKLLIDRADFERMFGEYIPGGGEDEE